MAPLLLATIGYIIGLVIGFIMGRQSHASEERTDPPLRPQRFETFEAYPVNSYMDGLYCDCASRIRW